MKPKYQDYPPATLANMLEQADAKIMHQRQVMDHMQGKIDSLQRDNDDLRQEVSAWRGK